jgi:serine/threonine protein kinase, bacterial
VPVRLAATSPRALVLQVVQSAIDLAGSWIAKLLARFVHKAPTIMTSEHLAELGPDSVVGAYRIVREIGRGGMATVYEAVHTVLPRRAALKVMHGALLRQPGMATRMVQEAAILEDVRHPGIVRVYECNLLPDRRPWIAMELVEGETLANRLHYAKVLSPMEVATLLTNVADVLAAVHHAGVIHRDLKPDNLLCTPTNRDYALRVLDWGVARLGPLGRLTMDGMTPGTPIYMSPEQATGHNIGPACDIYSLGVIAYEALTGNPPFDGRSLAEVVCMHLTREPAALEKRCSAPSELCKLVTRMLDKDPAQRPGAIEVRQIARAIALELSPPYEEFEVLGAEVEVSPTRGRSVRPAYMVPGDDAFLTDAESLEYGVTEMLPVVPKPRWTPELVRVPSSIPTMVANRKRQPIGPRAPRDQVAGEFMSSSKAR